MWFLFKSRAGCGCAPLATTIPRPMRWGEGSRTRYLAVMFGGACAGLAGAHLSLVYTPQWVENMTAGAAGSRWRWSCLPPGVPRVLAGAYLFGAVSIGQFHAQALGLGIPSQFLSALPYLATIAGT
jgi:ABC-type uncharacterized transport system permease subunit